ncbi:MAG TPA: hypothetical protein VK658_20730 [Chryseolinea sp.]|nr:hypothetical protein [Chryseolinea sp.]
MAKILKKGDQLNYEGKEWLITEVGEDNEGQVVYHLKYGDELSVLKESQLPTEMNVAQKQTSKHKQR